MWSNIVGSGFLISGILFAINPDRLRRRFRRKGVRIIKRYMFGAAAASGLLLVSLGREYEGAVPVVIVLAGVLLIVKSIFLLKAKSTEMLVARLMELPPLYLRVYACIHAGLGVVIILLPRA